MKLLVLVTLCYSTWGLPSDESRIVDGKPAAIENFSYQVRLSCKYPSHPQRSTCSGSIVDKHWILTAAHCVYGLSDCYVYYGSNTKGLNETSNQVVETKIHEEYSGTSMNNDIAMLKLRDQIEYKFGLVNSVALEPEAVAVADGVICGWGRTSTDLDSKLADNLLYTKVKVACSCYCRDLDDFSVVTQMCAPPTSGTGFSGDSGTALIANSKQIGIYSGRKRLTGKKDMVMVFNRVSFYYDWIVSKINA